MFCIILCFSVFLAHLCNFCSFKSNVIVLFKSKVASFTCSFAKMLRSKKIVVKVPHHISNEMLQKKRK